MKIVEGDLLTLAHNGEFDAIVHGCNCFCTMGGGIALHIRNQFPEAFAADLETKEGDRGKLGSYSVAKVIRGSHQFHIINAYTQYHYYGAGVLVDYPAIAGVFRKIRSSFRGQRIGYPKIGAGLGGGDWTQIAQIIDQELDGEDHTLVLYRAGQH